MQIGPISTTSQTISSWLQWFTNGVQRTQSREIATEQHIETAIFKEVFEGFKKGKTDFIPQMDDLPGDRKEEQEALTQRGIQSRITLPLFADKSLIGSMGFHAMSSNVGWADYTVDLLKIVAEIYLNLRDRQQIEQQVRYQANLLQNVTDAIVAADTEFTITSWNDAAQKIYGYAASDVIGKNVLDILQPEYPDSSVDEVYEFFAENRRWEGEVLDVNKDGMRIPLLRSVSAITDATDHIIGMVSVNRDIRARKQAEAQQIELTVQQERIQLLEDIISDLSHDIKTPLSSIKLNLYMLQKKTEPESQQKYLEQMEGQVKHLTKLVEDILTMSRLDKGGALDFAPINVNTLIKDISENYGNLIQEKGGSIKLETEPDIEIVRGNEIELGRAIANLVENAINYTHPGDTIIIETCQEHSDVMIKVQDSGIGISEEDLPHIFNRFYRADKARNTNQGGTGLGLAIVKRIVELHNGKIEVKSTLGKGSTFRIAIPTS